MGIRINDNYELLALLMCVLNYCKEEKNNKKLRKKYFFNLNMWQ